ncbi:tetratricopeptide repeat protein [Pseudoalteromonas piscicida]|uniref:Uncharacterized protein n=1 Tax=Pseudoalteromonas piscicida TaxID=43662 RepID=A0A2A5JSA4_PSEO7|nr:tetratricopeptide repeat protein [Pseudoalteromonas piscicida]PCK32219.1 hypothetical protein CEX98_08545 [Pseudoalteromonas piscicida]
MLHALVLVSSLAVLTPDELFKTLKVIQEQNISNPTRALQTYKNARPSLPREPSRGLYEIHLAGLKSGIRTNNQEQVREVIGLFSEEDTWLDYLTYEKGQVATFLAIYFRRNSQFELAERNYECAMRFSNTEQKQKIINNLAVLYRTTGQLDKATNILVKALSEFQEEAHLQAALNNNLANVYFDLGKYADAAELYRQAFLYHQKAGQTYEASYVGLNLLNAYILSERWDSYRRYINTVTMRVEQTKDTELITVLKWQSFTFQKKVEALELNTEQRTFLMDTLPMLMETDYSNNLTRYVSLMQLPALTALYKELANKEHVKAVDGAGIGYDNISLSWCK